MYHQTYRILQSLELSGHTLLGFSFLIGTFNQQYRLFILSFIMCSFDQIVGPVFDLFR